ncbi:alpha/beta fold hydrolase [Romboutsia sp.]|uniref:alpha/beta fold hydrolase n=1 Tax=Romboutsia sp. TaxID=1965302 RepID=UPI003F337F29
MRFYEFGDKSLPNIMLVHGAGWSYWMFLRQAKILESKYHVILPVLDGHGEESDILYSSTEKNADKIIEYIDKNCAGKVFAISGVSLGGQMVVEILSKRNHIADKAIIESGLCIPSPSIYKFGNLVTSLVGGLMFSKSFTKVSLKLLPKEWRFPEDMKKLYLRDIPTMKKENLKKILSTYFKYSLKEELKGCTADTIYWYGSKEMKCIKKSGQLFESYVKRCKVIELEKYAHAQISTYHPDEWAKRAEEFFVQ